MRRITTALVVVLIAIGTVRAQSAPADPSVTVPRLIHITGVFQPVDKQPPTDVEVVTLSIYAEQDGGLPVWQERQSVAVDKTGRFTLLLGASYPDGIPADVFGAGQAQWMSLLFERLGEVEQPRVRIASVPYALKASDAETLGGLPASAYLRASEDADVENTESARVVKGTRPAATDVVLPGTTNFLAKYVNGADVGNSAVYESGGRVGVGTTTPADVMHLQFTDPFGAITGLTVQNLGNTTSSYSGMLFYDQFGGLGQFQGFNNVTHEYRINNIATNGSINFMLGSSSKFLVRTDGDVDIPGSLRKGGTRLLHTTGNNTFLGMNAGAANTTGAGNAAIGDNALDSNTTGNNNTASGAGALTSNTTGFHNTASGWVALASNTTGFSNAAIGARALYNNTTGAANTAIGGSALTSNTTGIGNTAIGTTSLTSNSTGGNNTAIGEHALDLNTTGFNNVAIGWQAGLNATTGSNNIYLGANSFGVAGESNTMYLGRLGTQTKTVLAGVRGITTGVADAVNVVIDSTGQLGTINSSRRYKEDIQDMGEASSGLMKLRPVTYRYTQAYADGSKPIDYGLIAEEVEQVYPDLVAHLKNGDVETVQYHKINAMLLNEVQKQHCRLEEQHQQIETQRADLELLKARLAALERQAR